MKNYTSLNIINYACHIEPTETKIKTNDDMI